MEWLYLSIAGICEAVWALSMKSTEGFTRLMPSMLTASLLTSRHTASPTHALDDLHVL